MLHLSITDAERAEFYSVLRGESGEVRARGRAAILNSDHRVISNLSGWLLDGQVEWDTLAEVERTATATFLDPDGRAGLDSAAPTDANVRIDRYLQLRRDFWLPYAQTWVSVPLFTGPVSGVQRDGDSITVDAQGKESLALGPVWSPLSWGKSARKVDVIRDLLAKGAGEWAFSLPPGWGARLGRAKSVPRVIGDPQFTPWQQSKWLAQSMGGQLFYDARGVLRLRSRPVRSLWSLGEGVLAGPPEVTERTSEIRNVVVVNGGVPKGGTRPVTAIAELPSGHPWSPVALGRRGVGRRLIEEVDDSSIVSQSEADRVAKRRIRELEVSAWNMRVEALPMPLLEPSDLYRVDGYGVHQAAGLHQATIPVGGGLMSFGSVKTYRPRRWWR